MKITINRQFLLFAICWSRLCNDQFFKFAVVTYKIMLELGFTRKQSTSNEYFNFIQKLYYGVKYRKQRK